MIRNDHYQADSVRKWVWTKELVCVRSVYVQVTWNAVFGGLCILLPFLLVDIVGNTCEQLVPVMLDFFWRLFFLIWQSYSSIFLLMPLFYCLFCSLKDFIDDSDDFFLDREVRKSTTKKGKESSNSKCKADTLLGQKLAFTADLINAICRLQKAN